MNLLHDNAIDVVDKMSESVFVDMYLGQRALLIKGMLKDCSAMHQWSPKY